MIDILNKDYKPSVEEIDEYIGNPLFTEICEYIEREYKASSEIAYSSCSGLPGWNMKYAKSGKALCRLYPNKGYIKILVVIGRKEKDETEDMLPTMCEEMQRIYENTVEGMGQKWLFMDVSENDELYQDVLALIKIRRNSK